MVGCHRARWRLPRNHTPNERGSPGAGAYTRSRSTECASAGKQGPEPVAEWCPSGAWVGGRRGDPGGYTGGCPERLMELYRSPRRSGHSLCVQVSACDEIQCDGGCGGRPRYSGRHPPGPRRPFRLASVRTSFLREDHDGRRDGHGMEMEPSQEQMAVIGALRVFVAGRYRRISPVA